MDKQPKERARLTLDLPPDLHQELKVTAAMERVTMRELAEFCLRRCLADRQAKDK